MQETRENAFFVNGPLSTADVSRTSSARELVSGESPSRRTGTGVEPGTARWQETDVSAGTRTGVTGVITCRKKHIKTWSQYCPGFLFITF